MRAFLYQMYDSSLESYVLTQFMQGTAEQVAYSCKSLSVKKPETLLEKQDCILFITGEVDFETGEITLYKKKEVVFDYSAFFKQNYKKLVKEEVKEESEDVGKESEDVSLGNSSN